MFRAVFMLGPAKGKYMVLAAPRVPERLYLAPAPADFAEHFPTVNGLMVVGLDDKPPRGWDDVVVYELDRPHSRLTAHSRYEGMEQGEAMYRWASP